MNRDERRYIANLIDKFGADVLISMIPAPTHHPVAVAVARVNVSETVEECRLCPLGSTATCHVPAEWPGRRHRAPARFAVLGEAPGPEEDARGRPFVGRAGQLLRGALSKGSVNSDDVVYLNTVSCFPHEQEVSPRGKVRKVIRQPTDAEMLACRRNFLAQLDAANVRYVLICGSTALKAWRKDLRITQCQGKLGVMLNKWFVYPVLHPAAILRGIETVSEWERRIWRFIEIVEGDEGTTALETKCSKFGECGERFWMYDKDGLPWCEGHWVEGMDGHNRSVSWWLREMAKSDQMEMELGEEEEG